jgi:uncharacterized Zn-finger protein
MMARNLLDFTTGLASAKPFRHRSRTMSVPAPSRHDPAAASLAPANTQNQYAVTRADLPLSCPMPGMALWNSHPKVYLPIEAGGSVKCPYCGAQYTLAD